MVVSITRLVAFATLDPPTTPDQSLHGAKGYREAALDVLRAVPSGAVLGGFQSGALSYFAGDRLRVVNLDGVVNPGAAQAIRKRRLGEYARGIGVTHFADWEINYKAFAYFGGEVLERTRMVKVADSRAQGEDRFQLVQLVWPDP